MWSALTDELVVDYTIKAKRSLLDEVRRTVLALDRDTAATALDVVLGRAAVPFVVLHPDGTGTRYEASDRLRAEDFPTRPVVLVALDVSGAVWYVPEHGILCLYGVFATAQ